jgi:hypothetical protein
MGSRFSYVNWTKHIPPIGELRKKQRNGECFRIRIKRNDEIRGKPFLLLGIFKDAEISDATIWMCIDGSCKCSNISRKRTIEYIIDNKSHR